MWYISNMSALVCFAICVGFLGMQKNFGSKTRRGYRRKGMGSFLKGETRRGGVGRGGNRWLREGGDVDWAVRQKIPQNPIQNHGDSISNDGGNQGVSQPDLNDNLSPNNKVVISLNHGQILHPVTAASRMGIKADFNLSWQLMNLTNVVENV